MRSLAFNIAFGVISAFYTVWAALAALRPGRGERLAIGRAKAPA